MTTVAESCSGHSVRSSAWSNKFIIAAIVQGALITWLSLAFVAAQMLGQSIANC
jgi:hypothetical protein